MMLTAFGVSGSEFLNGFYSVDSINMTELDSISSIAKLMNDYMSCIVTERFEALSSERDLEIRAAELNKKKKFMAGRFSF